RRGRPVEADVVRLRRLRRAARTAVDAGRGYRGEDAAVEAPIPAAHGAVTDLEALDHGLHSDRAARRLLADFGHHRPPPRAPSLQCSPCLPPGTPQPCSSTVFSCAATSWARASRCCCC